MKVINILSEKGGIAKTTTALQLAVASADRGFKTLVVDGDTQGDASRQLLTDDQITELYGNGYDRTAAAAVAATDPAYLRKCIWQSKYANLDVLPSNGSLNRIMNELLHSPVKAYPVRLKRALATTDYDVVVVDNNPYFSLFSMNAVVAADEIIIPTDIEIGSLSKVQATLEDISDTIYDMIEAKPIDYRILVVKMRNNALDREGLEDLRTAYKDRVFTQTIRDQDSAVKRASAAHKALIRTGRQSDKVADDYRALIREYLGEGEVND